MAKLKYVVSAGADIGDRLVDKYASYLIGESEKNNDFMVDQFIMDARNSSSPNNEKIEWEERKAAEMWLKTQANYLLDNVHQIGDDDHRVPLSKTVDLTVDHIVGLARGKDSPIHAFFEWDESKGAISYRRHQALKLIREDRKHPPN